MQHFKAASDLDAERGAGAHGRARGQGTDSHHPRLGPASHGQLQLLGRRRPAGHHLRGGQGHRYLGPGQGGPAQPCGTAGWGWMQGVWGQVGDQETPGWHVVMREARATACKVGDALRRAAEPLGAQPWGQPAHTAWGRGTIPQPRLTPTIVPWPHQVRRRPRTSPARLTPTAAPSAAPGQGPARPFSVPG